MPFLDKGLLKRIICDTIKSNNVEEPVAKHPMLAVLSVPHNVRLAYLQGCVLATMLRDGDVSFTDKQKLIRLGESLELSPKMTTDCIVATAKCEASDKGKEAIVKNIVSLLAGNSYPRFFIKDFESCLPRVGGEIPSEMAEYLDYFAIALFGKRDWRTNRAVKECREGKGRTSDNEGSSDEPTVYNDNGGVVDALRSCLNEYIVIDIENGCQKMVVNEPPANGWGQEYKTKKIVFRLIRPGTFKMRKQNAVGAFPMGGPVIPIRITKPFYISIFPVTCGQLSLFIAPNPLFPHPNCVSEPNEPASDLTYDMIRGSKIGAKWPSSSDVDSNSIIGQIRLKTGLHVDLPTEAQWEYACRAGVETHFNNGKNWMIKVDGIGDVGNCYPESARYRNCKCEVGTHKANNWGIYDMHGNVSEWCLDWYEKDLPKEMTDPVGPQSGTYRVVRGGACNDTGGLVCSCSYRNNCKPSLAGYHGLRLIFTVE